MSRKISSENMNLALELEHILLIHLQNDTPALNADEYMTILNNIVSSSYIANTDGSKMPSRYSGAWFRSHCLLEK